MSEKNIVNTICLLEIEKTRIAVYSVSTHYYSVYVTVYVIKADCTRDLLFP